MYYQKSQFNWEYGKCWSGEPTETKVFGVLGDCFQKCKEVSDPKILRIIAVYHREDDDTHVMALFEVEMFNVKCWG